MLRATRSIMNQKGLTLVEVMVVLAITALLSAFAITYSKNGQRQITLYTEEQKIAELVLRAKSLAISTYTSPQDTCGYGFMVNYAQKTYSLFSYDLPNPANPDCDQIRITGMNPGRVSKLQGFTDIPLNTDLIFQTPSPADAIVYVLFMPPNPTTLISYNLGGPVSAGPGKIYLKTIDGSGAVTITVNRSGQVDF